MDSQLKWRWGIGMTLMIVEILLFIIYHRPAIVWLGNLGWILLWIAAFLAVIPVFTLRKRGGVTEGKSYIETTTLVDTGLYGVVRHPQYLSFMLICVGIILAAQGWIVTAVGIPATLAIYLVIRSQDRFLVTQFGDAYTDYMERVPRVNILLGIIRWLQRKK